MTAQSKITSTMITFNFSETEAIEWLQDRMAWEISNAQRELAELEEEVAETYAKRLEEVLSEYQTKEVIWTNKVQITFLFFYCEICHKRKFVLFVKYFTNAGLFLIVKNFTNAGLCYSINKTFFVLFGRFLG